MLVFLDEAWTELPKQAGELAKEAEQATKPIGPADKQGADTESTLQHVDLLGWDLGFDAPDVYDPEASYFSKQVFTVKDIGMSFNRLCKALKLPFEHHEIYHDWLIEQHKLHPRTLEHGERGKKLEKGLQVPKLVGGRWEMFLKQRIEEQERLDALKKGGHQHNSNAIVGRSFFAGQTV